MSFFSLLRYSSMDGRRGNGRTCLNEFVNDALACSWQGHKNVIFFGGGNGMVGAVRKRNINVAIFWQRPPDFDPFKVKILNGY